jgi:hypothetical protein
MRQKSSHHPLYSVLLGSLLVSTSAAAQGNYQASPLGGRSALLGGTGVATGVDGAAPFLNPASIVRIADQRIAFSARFFRLSERTLVGMHQPSAVDPAYGPLDLPNTTVKSTSLRTVPDTTCFFFSRSRGGAGQRAGRYKLALCLARTQDHAFDLTALNYTGQSAGRRVNQSQSLRESWGSWSFGPTFALQVTEKLAVGASLNVARTRHQTISSVATIAQDLASNAAVASAYQSADSGHSWDGIAQLGVTYILSQRVVLGASLVAPSVHFQGSYRASEDTRFESDTSSLSHWGGEGSFLVRHPMRIALGVGADFGRWRLEADGFFHTGAAPFARAELEREQVVASAGQVVQRSTTQLTRSESAKPVVNAGFGAEYFLSRNLGLLGGLASDLSALHRPPSGVNEGRLFHSRFNGGYASVGISSYTDFGDLVFGLRSGYRQGEFTVVNGFAQTAERDRITAREWELMLIIAGRISLNTVAEAAKHVTTTVTGDAPEPARTPPRPLQPPKRN